MIKVKNMIELEKFAGIAMPQNYRDSRHIMVKN